MTVLQERETTKAAPRLRGLSLEEMEGLVEDAGFDRYRGRQLFHWVQRKMARSFDEMKNLPKRLRAWLEENTELGGIHSVATLKHSADGSYKFLFELDDGKKVESVLMPDRVRNYWTQCLSSQVGCAVDCKFCVTGFNGFFRQMRVDEIVDQVLFARRYLMEHEPDANYRNLVYMGMGEPLLNTDAVIKSIEIVTSQDAIDLSPRRVTVSTSGITPGIIQLSESGVGACLALSLNASNQESRERIMPITKKYPLDELIDVCRSYPFAKNKRVTFEYVLMAGINDSVENAKEVRRMLSGFPCKMNVIPFNPSPQLPFERPGEQAVEDFVQIIKDSPICVSVRWSKALDVDGACGQLAGQARQRKGAPALTPENVSAGEMLNDLDFFAPIAAENAAEEDDDGED